MQQSIVKFYYFVVQTLLNMFRVLLCPSPGARQNCRCSLWFPYEYGGGGVLGRGREHVQLHIHTETRGCNGSLTGLLMMGIVMPETSWAVSVRQSNKILRLTVASSWVFYLNILLCLPSLTNAVIPLPLKLKFIFQPEIATIDQSYTKVACYTDSDATSKT